MQNCRHDRSHDRSSCCLPGTGHESGCRDLQCLPEISGTETVRGKRCAAGDTGYSIWRLYVFVKNGQSRKKIREHFYLSSGVDRCLKSSPFFLHIPPPLREFGLPCSIVYAQQWYQSRRCDTPQPGQIPVQPSFLIIRPSSTPATTKSSP